MGQECCSGRRGCFGNANGVGKVAEGTERRRRSQVIQGDISLTKERVTCLSNSSALSSVPSVCTNAATEPGGVDRGGEEIQVSPKDPHLWRGPPSSPGVRR